MVYHIIISKLSFKNMNTPFQGIHEKRNSGKQQCWQFGTGLQTDLKETK